MYSPKIRPKNVKKLYKLKQKTGKPMTKLANKILAKGIDNFNPKDEENKND